MAIKKAVQVGAPPIRARAASVKDVKAASVRRVVRALTNSMRAHGLVGMAAPQIGVSARIFVSEIRKTKFRKNIETDQLRVFINPRFIKASKKQKDGFEGCGSVANSGLFGVVKRAVSVSVRAVDINGKPFTLVCTGLLARIMQHEMDHLNGRVFLDRVSDTRTIISSDAYRALKKGR